MNAATPAVILAAGQGTRLRPLTDDKPKCMVPYKGKPLIRWQIEALRACGLRDIIVVGGYLAHRIDAPEARLVINPRYAETNMVHTLFAAREHLRGGFTVVYGDILFRPGILRALLDAPHDIAVAVDLRWRELWERRMADPLADAETLKLAPDGRLLELGKKPSSYADIQGQYMGLIKVSPAAAPGVIRFHETMDPLARYDGMNLENLYMTSFLQALIDSGQAVHAVPVRGGWLEVDAPADLNVDFVE